MSIPDKYECDGQVSIFDLTMPLFKIDKPIRLIELFAGIGSQAMALRDLGADFSHYRVVEFDKYAVKSYNAIHGTKFEPTDIRNVHGADLGIVETEDFTYLLTYSFPCGLAGTMIKTLNGYKKIEDVKIGDFVLTHKNKYEKVLKTMKKESPDYYEVRVLGYPKLRITAEHPMYVLRDGEIEWIKVKDLKLSDKVCFNININSVPTKFDDNVLWLLGRYVADGHINKYTYNSVNFAVAFKKEEQFINHIPNEMLCKFKKTKKKCWDYRIADADFQKLCLECGNGSVNKRVPQWVQDLPIEQARIFLDGYFSGDGHARQHGNQKQMMFSTVSKELFLGIQNLIMKVYGVVCSCSIRVDERKDSFNDTYNGQFALSGKVLWQEKIGNQIFTPIRQIKRIENKVPVFNFEVENDNSYTMENIIVHNCQDLSVAGKQKGMKKGSGTRSGLLWEVERLLNETEHLPQVLLMENVPQVHSQDNMSDFQKWIDFLASKGYTNWWQDLNARDYGVAQNRNRCFMVSILGEYNYKFPKPIPLDKTMKDYLEEKVDDKYYLTSEKAKKLTDTLILQGKIPTDRQTDRQTDRATIDLCTKNPRIIDKANCIKARYDDGISNLQADGSGVVEWSRF